MKQKTLGLVHTSATLVPVFGQLCNAKLPGVNVFNIADDSLVKGIIASGSLTPQIARRVAGYLESAELAGADYIMVTCSSIGPAVEAAAKLIGVPVLRVDQPMADLAVALGKSIGVIATLRTTLEPTADLIARRAALAGRPVNIVSRPCEGAFEALMAGDAAKHDLLVAGALKELALRVDVVVLAQASMAWVVDRWASWGCRCWRARASRWIIWRRCFDRCPPNPSKRVRRFALAWPAGAACWPSSAWWRWRAASRS